MELFKCHLYMSTTGSFKYMKAIKWYKAFFKIETKPNFNMLSKFLDRFKPIFQVTFILNYFLLWDPVSERVYKLLYWNII